MLSANSLDIALGIFSRILSESSSVDLSRIPFEISLGIIVFGLWISQANFGMEKCMPTQSTILPHITFHQGINRLESHHSINDGSKWPSVLQLSAPGPHPRAVLFSSSSLKGRYAITTSFIVLHKKYSFLFMPLRGWNWEGRSAAGRKRPGKRKPWGFILWRWSKPQHWGYEKSSYDVDDDDDDDGPSLIHSLKTGRLLLRWWWWWWQRWLWWLVGIVHSLEVLVYVRRHVASMGSEELFLLQRIFWRENCQ